MESDFIRTLEQRFNINKSFNENINWIDIEKKLLSNPKSLESLKFMEETGGEPSFFMYDVENDKYLFTDYCHESPIGRRNLCYDENARLNRKKFPPSDSAMNLAKINGLDLMSEDQYHLLQSLGDFDLKTSSWLKTPYEIRSKGGAIFGDKRYGRTFFYHNGADSYYASRGVRVISNL